VMNLLTIDPGTTLVFMNHAGLKVSAAGGLAAAGTAEAPVVFTGEAPTPGYWNGISFDRSAEYDNVISHATIEYATGVRATGSADYPVQLSVTDSAFQYSSGCGLSYGDNCEVNADIDSANTFLYNAGGDVCGP